MRWQLSEEQEAYKQSFGGWLADVAPREVMRRWLDGGDAALLDGQRQLAVLERQRFFAEQFAPPAPERRNIRRVVGRDALEIVDRGDHLGSNVVTLRDHAQQHLEQFDHRRCIGGGLRAHVMRQGFWIARQSAFDRGDDRLAPARAFEPLGQRPQMLELLDGRRRLHGDVADRVVLEHARARHVAGLRLALAPGRDLDQDREFLGLAHARLEPLPRALRIHAVGLGRGQHLHLVLDPVGAAAAAEIFDQRVIDVAQMGDVGNGVSELRLGQRPARPVGETI